MINPNSLIYEQYIHYGQGDVETKLPRRKEKSSLSATRSFGLRRSSMLNERSKFVQYCLDRNLTIIYSFFITLDFWLLLSDFKFELQISYHLLQQW